MAGGTGELETHAAAGTDERYPFDIVAGDPWQIGMRPAIRSIVRDVQEARPVGYIAARSTTCGDDHG